MNDSLIGRPLDDIFLPKAVHDLRNRLATLRGPNAVDKIFDLTLSERAGAFDVAMHISGGQIVIEAQPAAVRQGDTTSMVQAMLARLDQKAKTSAFFDEGARQVRGLTGFDRVMVYRFSDDGSGEVVAESCKPGIGSFKGLHYPSTDIPAQARELYKRNVLRVIADVNAIPVAIQPVLDEAGKPLDLSQSILRSVSPIHIEYLKNMGVRASMSISIIVDGELWGLFACHHYSAKSPSFEVRSVCELFAQMYSMRLESRERKEQMDFERGARDISDQLLSAFATNETLLNDPEWLAGILTHVIPAEGVGVWINGAYAFSGVRPSTDAFTRIVRALNSTAANKVYVTDHIASLVPGAEGLCRPSRRHARDPDLPLAARLRDPVPGGAGPLGALGRRSAQAGHLRPERPAPHPARKLRRMAAAREGPQPAVHASRDPRRPRRCGPPSSRWCCGWAGEASRRSATRPTAARSC